MINEEKKYELIKFMDGDFVLDVNVSPSEDTVWLTQRQISELFDSSKSNVSEHIKHILETNELDSFSVVRKIRTTAKDGKKYLYDYYNLDMIIAIGYRVNSKRGTLFRKWANQILKQYLLNGYSINEERCITCHSSILQIENKINEMQNKIHNIEDTLYQENEKLLYEGEILDAYTFIRKLFFLAKKEITIIDYYADKFLLSMLIDVKVKINIITSSNSYLNNIKLQENISIIKNDLIHDRFIIIDDTVYIIGTSFNEIGKKRFVIIKSNYLTKDKLLK